MASKFEFGRTEDIQAAKKEKLNHDITVAADHLMLLLADLDKPSKWQDSLYNHLDHLWTIDKIGKTDGYSIAKQ